MYKRYNSGDTPVKPVRLMNSAITQPSTV